jgi:hypothetical protein
MLDNYTLEGFGDQMPRAASILHSPASAKEVHEELIMPMDELIPDAEHRA